MEFVEARKNDLAALKGLYDYYIKNSTATFHLEELSLEELKRIIPLGHAKYKSYLVKEGEELLGYCYLSRYKPREAYDRTAEVTVYLNPQHTGKGLGIACLDRLEGQARLVGIKVLVGVITAENEASIRLFEKAGYEKCAHFRQVGEKFGRILDVAAYQKFI